MKSEPCPTCGQPVEGYYSGRTYEGGWYSLPTLIPCGHGVDKPVVVEGVIKWVARS